MPADLVERGRKYDAGRTNGATVEVRSNLPIETQTRAVGATWLDRLLIDGRDKIAPTGFGGEVHAALRERESFLVEQGFAQRHGDRVIPDRDLIAKLRGHELETVGKALAKETGLTYNPTADGTTVSGVYSRSVSLVSGQFAMLDDGLGFTLVPWRPVIEHRIGQSLSVAIDRESVSWTLGRERGLSR